MKVRADELHKGDTIALTNVFYKVLDRRPDNKEQARFQLQTLAGSVIQVDIDKETMIEVFK